MTPAPMSDPARIRQLDHACVLIRATDFMELGKLVPHEKLRDANMLRFFDTPDALNDALIVFFSHRTP